MNMWHRKYTYSDKKKVNFFKRCMQSLSKLSNSSNSVIDFIHAAAILELKLSTETAHANIHPSKFT